jgi:hypothetical protein
MKLRNKLFSLCLALLLIIPFAAIPGLAANSTVSIGTPEEFIEFAVNAPRQLEQGQDRDPYGGYRSHGVQ